ncbi:MAG: hypothetical protein IPK08_01640 [Bacteroidetes bacterium]|nr:hypothetical protein [Bacteroidota bacterium]
MAINNGIAPDNDIESCLIEHYQRTQDISEREGELAADSAFYLERTVGMPTIHGKFVTMPVGNLLLSNIFQLWHQE